MKHIVVASTNPTKLKATENAFKRAYPNEKFKIAGVSVPSSVSHQPMSDDETIVGAYSRSMSVEKVVPQADFWVGIEGGVEIVKDGMLCMAWVVVRSKKITGKAKTSAFYIPQKMAKLIQNGVEMGDADDMIFGNINSKQKNGTVGALTGNLITRASYYEDAALLALIPFMNKTLYTTRNE